MARDCWLRPRPVIDELQNFFERVDEGLSTYYDDNRDVREEHLEGRLVTLLEHLPLEPYRRRIAKERRRIGKQPVDLHLSAKHITSTEGMHGADIGLVAQISVPGELEVSKA